MARHESSPNAPTMIIPAGTEVEVDGHGQLSIRTPGNLVIQNSGAYGDLESTTGSIRIEANAEVEAVRVNCAQTCYIQGSLTAWKVEAQSIQLEEGARANIVLQESDELGVGRDARLVGNFKSEKDLFLLFSRFARQFRALPLFGERGDEVAAEAAGGPGPVKTGRLLAPLAVPAESEVRDLPDPLFFALILLEREAARSTYGPTSQRALAELSKLLRERDLETLRDTHGAILGRVVDAGPDVQRAAELIAEHCRGMVATAAAIGGDPLADLTGV